MFTKTAQRFATLRFMFENRRHFRDFILAKERDKNAIWRKPGRWYDPDIQKYTEMVANVGGDFAEIGVFEGETFAKLIPIAHRQDKSIHAFDSFHGMDDPSEFDWRPKGQFAVGGTKGFRKLMKKRGFDQDQYLTWEGFIPECFMKAPNNLSFSFVLLDVDNYEPTRMGLDWAWSRLNVNGVVALDDFYPNGEGEASKAIKEFLRERNDFDIIDFLNFQLALRKMG
jgi:hypothetical protein